MYNKGPKSKGKFKQCNKDVMIQRKNMIKSSAKYNEVSKTIRKKIKDDKL